MLKAVSILICHALWFLSCLPSWGCFLFALRRPRRAQERILLRLLRKNQNTAFGMRLDFESIRSAADFAARVPAAEYADFAGDIEAARRGEKYALAAEGLHLLEPTSGSTDAPKLIPVTASSRREFAAAVQPWIAWLYLAHPSLFLGRQYWAISPNTPPPLFGNPSAVPVGFADDAEYLGAAGRWLAHTLLAVPGAIRQVADPEAFALLTLLFLIKERGLRLISVWHPTFLTLLLDALPKHLPAVLSALRTGSLPGDNAVGAGVLEQLSRHFRGDVRRAAEVASYDLVAHPERVGCLWPKLAVISCWEGSRSEPWLGRLRSLFPRAVVQGKGLLATEGCVTLPTGCGRLRPCAIRSHYLEFSDDSTGRIHPVWELQQGETYSVLLTTGAGLWRYRLHDQVRVDGYCQATPCLTFMGKDNEVSDLVGEKLDERHVAAALAAAERATGMRAEFAMLVPSDRKGGGELGYLLLLEFGPSVSEGERCAQNWAEAVEVELQRNFHYAHARRLGQLEPVRPVHVRKGARAFEQARKAEGARAATVKMPALSRAHNESGAWWMDAVASDE